MKYRITTSNERVLCTTQLAKLSFKHSIGRTHSWRFSTFYQISSKSHHRVLRTHGSTIVAPGGPATTLGQPYTVILCTPEYMPYIAGGCSEVWSSDGVLYVTMPRFLSFFCSVAERESSASWQNSMQLEQEWELSPRQNEGVNVPGGGGRRDDTCGRAQLVQKAAESIPYCYSRCRWTFPKIPSTKAHIFQRWELSYDIKKHSCNGPLFAKVMVDVFCFSFDSLRPINLKTRIPLALDRWQWKRDVAKKKFELERYPPTYFCTARYEHKSSKKKFQTFLTRPQ